MTMIHPTPTLVILGTRRDPHVERVASEVERRGRTRVFVLDYHRDIRFSLEEDMEGCIVLRIDDTTLAARYAVWDRTKILPGTDLYIEGDPSTSGFAAQEWRGFYKLLCGLNGDQVMNSLKSRSCLIKPYQQAIAASVGFRVPPTLISNDKSCVRTFQRRHERLIMKSISAGKYKPATDGGDNVLFNVMTMAISPDDLEAATPEEIAYCPHFLQREISKSHELRVVVVDDCVMPFKVESQAHELSSLDWRKGGYISNFAPTSLDDAVLGQIRAFMRRIGLFTGSIDLIVDRENQVWFLECNEAGAWGWLDDVAEGAVTRAFADAFDRRAAMLVAASPAC
jgi:hypothetical protein